MPILGIYDKETKKLLSEIEIDQETYELLKKQKDPSLTFENAVKKWLKDEIKE